MLPCHRQGAPADAALDKHVGGALAEPSRSIPAGVPTLLGLAVVAVAQKKQAPGNRDVARLPQGLQKYVLKLREWASQRQSGSSRLRPPERAVYGDCPKSPTPKMSWTTAGEVLERDVARSGLGEGPSLMPMEPACCARCSSGCECSTPTWRRRRTPTGTTSTGSSTGSSACPCRRKTHSSSATAPPVLRAVPTSRRTSLLGPSHRYYTSVFKWVVVTAKAAGPLEPPCPFTLMTGEPAHAHAQATGRLEPSIETISGESVLPLLPGAGAGPPGRARERPALAEA